jgi:ABC-type multidrug transport system fused ATPase/permease subunit
MQAEAYRRARRLLSAKPGAVAMAHVLGILQALLILMLLLVGGLLAALMASRGEAHFPAAKLDLLPRWVATAQAASVDQGLIIFQDSGLFPIVASNLDSDNRVHKAVARVLSNWLRAIPVLRNNLGALTGLLALGLGLLLLLTFLTKWRRSILAEQATRVAAVLRGQIHRQMYRLGQSALPTEGTGPIVNLFTREVDDIQRGIFTELNDAYRLPVLAIGLVLIALLIDVYLPIALAALGALVIFFLARKIGEDARLALDAATRNAAVQLCLLHEDLGLIRSVRVYGMEGIDKQRFEEHLERYRQADERRLALSGHVNPTTVLVYGAALTVAILLIGYNIAVSGKMGAAAGLLMIVSLAGLAVPIREWLGMARTIRQANRSAVTVFDFLERKPELQQAVGAQFLPALRERITFENVTLESRSGAVLLEGVSAEIPAGSKTAIMGRDEDAKHALVLLIPRLIDPKVGRVRIDGLDLRDVTLESLRAQVALVLQVDLIFSDSVLMNIGLGDPSYELPRIIEAAKVAHAHNFIQDLPHGYDTIIGPLGHYLKPDEQYRIALARAYLHDPSIVILEEPDVPLDDDTKHLIDDTVARLAQGRTLIILPHRLSTIRSCQQIIVLNNGRVDAVGQPRQLQNESKLYRHLQYVEFNQFATGEIEAGQMNA